STGRGSAVPWPELTLNSDSTKLPCATRPGPLDGSVGSGRTSSRSAVIRFNPGLTIKVYVSVGLFSPVTRNEPSDCFVNFTSPAAAREVGSSGIHVDSDDLSSWFSHAIWRAGN